MEQTPITPITLVHVPSATVMVANGAWYERPHHKTGHRPPDVPSDAQRTISDISEMMKRKQPSGAMNRKKAREKLAAAAAAGTLMPPLPTIEDVSSLTALTGTRLRYLCEWLQKRLTTDDYAVFVRTLSEFRADAIARITERQVEADELLARQLEQHEARLAGGALVELPALGSIELMPGAEVAQ